MSSMVKLVQNEQMKIYRRLRTWIMLSIVVLTAVFIGFVVKRAAGEHIDHLYTYMEMSDWLTFMPFVFAVIIAGDMVASEYSWGTIKLLLIRPASRTKILFAKYIAVLLFVIVLLALLFISMFLTGLFLFGAGGNHAGNTSLWTITRSFIFYTIDISMSATLAFMISTVFRSSSLAIGLSIFLMFTSSVALSMLVNLGYDWAKYLLFANTDLSPYFTGANPPVPGMTLSFSVAMLLIYWLFFLGISWVTFKKRDVAGF